MQDARFGLGGCNCQGGLDDCPLQGRCQSRGLVYKATVSSVEGEQDYLGQTTTTFKLRHSNHTNSYRDPSKKKQTSLSKYVWELSARDVDCSISYSIATLANPHRRGGRGCDICLTEKTLIARADKTRSLNKRNEVMNRCRHLEPHMLMNYYSRSIPPTEEEEPQGEGGGGAAVPSGGPVEVLADDRGQAVQQDVGVGGRGGGGGEAVEPSGGHVEVLAGDRGQAVQQDVGVAGGAGAVPARRMTRSQTRAVIGSS